MAHYAFLDENNVVIEVITGKNEGEDDRDWEVWYGAYRGKVCKRTSYNTQGNVHILGGTPFRKNFARVGFIYQEDIDGFIPPKPILRFYSPELDEYIIVPYSSWALNTNTGLWEAPVPKPTTNDPDKNYEWNEKAGVWVEMSNSKNYVWDNTLEFWVEVPAP